MILKSETYHFHRLDPTRRAGFIVTIYDEDGLRLANTPPLPTPAPLRRYISSKFGSVALCLPPAYLQCTGVRVLELKVLK
jgi:hypothetical protein